MQVAKLKQRIPKPDDDESEYGRPMFLDDAFRSTWQENDYIAPGVRRRHVYDYEQMSEEE
jgi:hypothetical protein